MLRAAAFRMLSPVSFNLWALWSEGMTVTGPKECPNAVEDGVGQGWAADGLVPVLDRQLACDDG